MTLAAGSRLGPYELVAPIGAGGMEEVYRARDSHLGRDVAVKVLPAKNAADDEMRERFEREARTISRLSHPAVCSIFDVGSHEGVPYLGMELLEGQSLAERLAKGPIPVPQALRVARDVCQALEAAHRKGSQGSTGGTSSAIARSRLPPCPGPSRSARTSLPTAGSCRSTRTNRAGPRST
mgnify:CR=1 FL=1